MLVIPSGNVGAVTLYWRSLLSRHSSFTQSGPRNFFPLNQVPFLSSFNLFYRPLNCCSFSHLC